MSKRFLSILVGLGLSALVTPAAAQASSAKPVAAVVAATHFADQGVVEEAQAERQEALLDAAWPHRVILQVDGMVGPAFHAGGAVEVRLLHGLHVGPAGFVNIDHDGYGFFGLRASYRLRIAQTVMVGPWIAAGAVNGGSLSNEYAGREVRSAGTVAGGLHLSYPMGRFLAGIEGGAMPVAVRDSGGLYVANPSPPSDTTVWVGFGSLVLGMCF